MGRRGLGTQQGVSVPLQLAQRWSQNANGCNAMRGSEQSRAGCALCHMQMCSLYVENLVSYLPNVWRRWQQNVALVLHVCTVH